MSADYFSLTSKSRGHVEADVSTGRIFLRALMPGTNQHAELSAASANELGHWLLSVAEQLRLEAGE